MVHAHKQVLAKRTNSHAAGMLTTPPLPPHEHEQHSVTLMGPHRKHARSSNHADASHIPGAASGSEVQATPSRSFSPCRRLVTAFPRSPVLHRALLGVVRRRLAARVRSVPSSAREAAVVELHSICCRRLATGVRPVPSAACSAPGPWCCFHEGHSGPSTLCAIRLHLGGRGEKKNKSTFLVP